MRRPFTFDGRTFDRELDFDRLKTQQQRVLVRLLDGAWHDLPTLREHCGSAADSRIRDLRKEPYSMVVDRRRVEGRPGVWEYRLDLGSVDDATVQKILDGDVPKTDEELDDDFLTSLQRA